MWVGKFGIKTPSKFNNSATMAGKGITMIRILLATFVVALLQGCAGMGGLNAPDSGTYGYFQSDFSISEPSCQAVRVQSGFWAATECQRAYNQRVMSNRQALAADQRSQAYQWAELCAEHAWVGPNGFVIYPSQYCVPRNPYESQLRDYAQNLGRDRAFQKAQMDRDLRDQAARRTGDAYVR
ncbi:MAG: hypothetical protein AAB513_02000 [Patescibacteria group bacterium]